MEKTLSQIKDVDQKILSELDDKSLFEFCITHKYGSTLCRDDLFWKKRFIIKYGHSNKNADRSWKNFYMNVIYYNDKYKGGALYELSKKGIKNFDLINFYLVRGSDVNMGMLGAVTGGHKDLVEYYIERGANDFINGYLNAQKIGRQDLMDLFRQKGLMIFRMI